MQTDPIRLGDGMNMYAYVRGDPINYADATGLNYNVPGGYVDDLGQMHWDNVIQGLDVVAGGGNPNLGINWGAFNNCLLCNNSSGGGGPLDLGPYSPPNPAPPPSDNGGGLLNEKMPSGCRKQGRHCS